jgi:transposase
VISVPAGVRILLATRPVDFRRGAHALAALAAETLGESPYSGTVLVFRARRSDRVKILLWDASGLVLVWKQLQQGGFVWPPVTGGAVRLSAAQFAALFDGLDWSRLATTRRIPAPRAAA